MRWEGIKKKLSGTLLPADLIYLLLLLLNVLLK